MFKKLPLVTKLILTITIVLVVGLGAGLVAITEKAGKHTDALSYKVGEGIGQHNAALVERRLNDAMDVSRFIASSIVSLKAAGVTNRAQINAMLRSQLEANTNLLGVWVGLEPNVLDGKDSVFVNTPGTDASGRFIPYWNRGSGQIALEALTAYEDQGADGAYYQVPKRLLREVVVEPYAYVVAGKSILMVSLVVPIIENGKFIGNAGVDLGTDGIWEDLKGARPFGTGAVYLISNEGKWVGYANREHLGKPIVETNERLKNALGAIKEGQMFSQMSFSQSLKTDVKQLFIPIHVGSSPTPWSILVNMPVDKVEVPKNELRTVIIVGALVLTAALLLALWLSTRHIVGVPLRRIIATVQALTSGNNDVEVMDRDRSDEIGAINQALQLFKENAARVAQMEEQRRRDEQAAAEHRRRDLNRLADDFEGSVGGVVAQVAEQSENIRGDSEALPPSPPRPIPRRRPSPMPPISPTPTCRRWLRRQRNWPGRSRKSTSASPTVPAWPATRSRRLNVPMAQSPAWPRRHRRSGMWST